MICLENFSQLIIFAGLCTLPGGKADHSSNGLRGEIDAMPIPKEELQKHFKAIEMLKRSLDETDDGVDSRTSAARYLPREFFNRNDQCDMNQILNMHRQCQCRTPRKKCVRIDNPHGTVLTTMPECVIVERCEGICPYSTNCVAKETKFIDVPIVVTTLVPDKGDSMKVESQCKTIQVEKHVKCSCACELNEKDCPPEQVFRPDVCQCQCPNLGEAEQCRNENKEWNPFTCKCACPSNVSQECSSGAFFHKAHCRCVPAKTERAWRRSRLLKNL